MGRLPTRVLSIGVRLGCFLQHQLGLGRNITGGSQVKQYEADELPTQGLAEFLIHKTLGGDKESCFKHTWAVKLLV